MHERSPKWQYMHLYKLYMPFKATLNLAQDKTKYLYNWKHILYISIWLYLVKITTCFENLAYYKTGSHVKGV